MNEFIGDRFGKQDNRPTKYGWAPGNYICTCHVCKEQFLGEKRAVTCADCAYSNEYKVPTVSPETVKIIEQVQMIAKLERSADPLQVNAADEIKRLQSSISQLKRYFQSNNDVSVEMATIKAKDFFKIIGESEK